MSPVGSSVGDLKEDRKGDKRHVTRMGELWPLSNHQLKPTGDIIVQCCIITRVMFSHVEERILQWAPKMTEGKQETQQTERKRELESEREVSLSTHNHYTPATLSFCSICKQLIECGATRVWGTSCYNRRSIWCFSTLLHSHVYCYSYCTLSVQESVTLQIHKKLNFQNKNNYYYWCSVSIIERQHRTMNWTVCTNEKLKVNIERVLASWSMS